MELPPGGLQLIGCAASSCSADDRRSGRCSRWRSHRRGAILVAIALAAQLALLATLASASAEAAPRIARHAPSEEGRRLQGDSTVQDDAQWLELSNVLGHSGDSFLRMMLPSVPKQYRLVVTYVFRSLWLLVEILIILHCEFLKDKVTRDCKGILEIFLVTARFVVLHILPVSISFCAAMDGEGDGPWASFCRVMLFADSIVYIGALVPLLWVRRARRLLLRTQALTVLRVFKLVTTPLETLVVIHGIFGLGFHYASEPQARTKRLSKRGNSQQVADSSTNRLEQVPVSRQSLMSNASSALSLADHQSELDSEDEEDEDQDERMLEEVFAEDQVNVAMLWALWAMSMLAASVFGLQWLVSDERPCAVRIVATAIFGTYGLGSGMTALLYCVAPDVLAASGYGFARLKDRPGKASPGGWQAGATEDEAEHRECRQVHRECRQMRPGALRVSPFRPSLPERPGPTFGSAGAIHLEAILPGTALPRLSLDSATRPAWAQPASCNTEDPRNLRGPPTRTTGSLGLEHSPW